MQSCESAGGGGEEKGILGEIWGNFKEFNSLGNYGRGNFKSGLIMKSSNCTHTYYLHVDRGKKISINH